MRFIGDVHGHMEAYSALLSGVDASIQVGDFGAGFSPIPLLGAGHRFIRGNHDSPDICRVHPNWIADGTVEGDTMFIGGGESIDKDDRTPGIDWWADEELSYFGLQSVIDVALTAKPRVMVTHEVPSSVVTTLFGQHRRFFYPASRTSLALNAIWENHKPDIWVFGHWHINVDQTILGTRFICLAPLNYIDL